MLDYQKAARLQWAEALLCNPTTETWQTMAESSLACLGGKTAFSSSNSPLKGISRISNPFWKEVLIEWITFEGYSESKNIYNEPIFNNVKVTYHNTPLFIERCIDKNVVQIKDMYDQTGLLS